MKSSEQSPTKPDREPSGELKPGGVSLNPEGRPKGSLNKYKGKPVKLLARELVATWGIDALEHHLKKNSLEALRIALEYGYGKPIQQQLNINMNMNYSSWTDEQIEEFSETGQMPMIQGDQEGDKPVKDAKQGLNGKSKEVK